MLNLRVLTYFLAVAREQNITKAADALHITQPTLSRQLQQMEEELGVKLFERSQHKLTLTQPGNLLVHRAQEILELAEKTELDLHDQESNLSGNIVIGAGELRAVNDLAVMLREFQKLHPAVTFDLFTNTTDLTMDKMEKGLIDIAILLAPFDTSSYRYLKMPHPERFGVLMRADSPLAEQSSLKSSDLAGQSLLLPTRAQVRGSIYNWLSGDINNIKILGTSNLHCNTESLVYINSCYSICSEPALLDNSKLAFRQLDPPIESNVYLAWRSDAKLSLTVQKFIEFAECFLSMNSASN